MNIPINIVIEFLVLITALAGAIIPVWVSSRNRISKLETRVEVQETELRHHKENDEKDTKRWEEVFKRLGNLETHLAKIETTVGNMGDRS